MPAVDRSAMRHAMGCWTTGVAVIATADRNGRPHGMTVNSLTSVSLDPPLLLACLTHGACRSAEKPFPLCLKPTNKHLAA